MKNIIAMIPARIGSERVKFKNLRLLGDKPLISYATEAAQQSGIFSRIVINSDFAPLKEIADELGVDFYHRPPEFGLGQSKSDEVIANFLENNDCDYLFWVNPTSPLQLSGDFCKGLQKMETEKLDTLFTITSRKIHSIYHGEPLNFSSKGLFPRSQDLEPVSQMVFSFMGWKTSSFLSYYRTHGFAFYSGKIGYLEIDPLTAIDIDEEVDFQLAESIIQWRRQNLTAPQYHPIIKQNFKL